jgi:lipopolysaccharide export system permease protein
VEYLKFRSWNAVWIPVKIINRYILKEHIGPFVFALSALTSLLLLQYIARRFGDLVGKGLSWAVITEFFLLSIPFTLAMTLPMAMLVAVLYAFSRLASENEVTALKAGGISTRTLMIPAVISATLLAMFMLWFNDQILPRANHELATLQMAILRTKPTFALRPQVINTIKESQLYLRAGQIDEGSSGLLKDVTIYDVSDGGRRRTIYADSGKLTLAPNHRDLTMHLFKGMMMSAPSARTGQLSRIYYAQDILKVRDVANQFQSINADTASKGDREMSVCEMQKQYEIANASVQRAHADSLMAVWRMKDDGRNHIPAPKDVAPKKAGGIGAVYCNLITKYFKVKELHAEVLPRQDTTKRQPPKPPAAASGAVAPQHPDSVFVMVDGKFIKVAYNKIPPNAYYPGGIPAGAQAIKDAAMANGTASAVPPGAQPPKGGAVPAGATTNAVPTPPNKPLTGVVADPPAGTATSFELTEAHLRLEEARFRRNRAGVEIQKKFSLAFACIVFVLVGAPIALRFPRGGVGLVIGASFLVFAIYYVGLIGGESLANKNIISPFWAMWADNVIFLIAGVILMSRMGREGVTGRGGNMGEIIDRMRAWFARQGRRVGIGSARSSTIS